MFCLTWLQLATIPCVMAAAASHASLATPAAEAMTTHAMPPMQMAADEHCLYCPPADAGPAPTGDHAPCSYPHDPQVDSRAGLALGLALPAAMPLFASTLGIDEEKAAAPEAQPAAAPGTSLAVSYCRFLK